MQDGDWNDNKMKSKLYQNEDKINEQTKNNLMSKWWLI